MMYSSLYFHSSYASWNSVFQIAMYLLNIMHSCAVFPLTFNLSASLIILLSSSSFSLGRWKAVIDENTVRGWEVLGPHGLV